MMVGFLRLALSITKWAVFDGTVGFISVIQKMERVSGKSPFQATSAS